MMERPKTAQVEVELIPVACDIIAEYGQLLEARRTPDGLVVIGVYTPSYTGTEDIKAAPKTTATASGIRFYPQGEAKPPRVEDSIFLDLIEALAPVTLAKLRTAVRMQLHDNIAPHIVRDRMVTLERRGQVISFRPDANSPKCYQLARQGEATEAA
jgi:hypothetical protein